MIERPEGIQIAAVFILGIVITSLVSRTLRSTELRVLGIVPDPLAESFIDEAARGREINIIANRPGPGDQREYDEKLREARETHHLKRTIRCCSWKWNGATPEFARNAERTASTCTATVLRSKSPAVPNATRALLKIRDRTGKNPHVLRLDRRQTSDVSPEVPRARRRRHGAGAAEVA
jgi:hypothetical protein